MCRPYLSFIKIINGSINKTKTELTATEANKYPSNEKEVFVPSYGHEDSAY